MVVNKQKPNTHKETDMAKNNINKANTDTEKYRKQLGKQEFRGRNKKETLAMKERAQARKQESSLKSGVTALVAFVVLLTVIYLVLYYMLMKK